MYLSYVKGVLQTLRDPEKRAQYDRVTAYIVYINCNGLSCLVFYFFTVAAICASNHLSVK